jgi:upstream activation factor subunit UAF30
MRSDPLAQVIGVERLSRPQVVKQLWDYIKKNQLQNPENKKEILLDDKMKAVFGGDKIDMFMMNKALGK